MSTLIKRLFQLIIILIVLIALTWSVIKVSANDVKPNMQQVKLAMKDQGLLKMINECKTKDKYLSYSEVMDSIVIAIEQDCNFKYGVYNKVILLDVFSNEYSYKRVMKSSLQRIE